MEEDRPQKELFPYETPKKRFSGFAGMFRKAGIDGSVFAITLKIDKLVFISIAIIMTMVVVYALGVERGRSVKAKINPAPVQHAAPLEAVPEPKPLPVTQPAAAVAVKEDVMPYTIAVAALSKKETALREAARMRNNGFDSSVMYREPYYVVCVGTFADKTSVASKKELARVRRLCRDAYFKQR